jgi:VCBS repeat-containing protein
MKALSIGKTSYPMGNRGVATLEILIAFALLIMSMTAVILVVFGNQSITIDTQTNDEAVSKAQALVEQARALSRQDFNSVVSIGTAPDDIYQKTLTVTSLDASTKQVTGTVTWTTAGRPLSVNFTTLLTSPPLGASSCSPTLTGDWTAPQIYGYADFPSSAGATGVSVRNGKAFVTSDPSSASTDDFYVIDVGGAGPGVGTLPTLGHFSTTYGLTDIRAVGNYAYVAAHSTAFQFLVIDISDPTTLNTSKIVAKKDVTASTDTAVGNTIFYANKKVYLGLTLSTGKEFHIFDVSTPTAPVELGTGYEVGAAVNGIVVKNNIAYLATAANNEVIALNVTDPTNITTLGTYTSATLTGQALAQDSGTTLYFGRIGGNGNPKLLALDTANLSTPKWTMNMSKQSGVYSEILRGNLLFMTTADPNDGLQVWDISNASASVAPTRWDTSPLNIQQSATAGSDCAGNFLYVAQRSNRALQVIGPFASPPPPTFGYTLAPAFTTLSVAQGNSVSNTITITKTLGTAQTVTLTASGVQNNVTVTATPVSGSCTPNTSCVVMLTFAAANNAQKKTNTITITGTPLGVTTTFQLTVN